MDDDEPAVEQDIVKLMRRIGKPQDEALRALSFCLRTLRRIEYSGEEGRCPDCGDKKPRHSQECHIEAAFEIATEAVRAS